MRKHRPMLPMIAALLVSAVPCAVFGQDETAEQPLTPEELEGLVAPIALYSDPLIAQVLMASTYPLEIVEAARWSKANPTVTGDAISEAMTKQSWDPSVKSLVPFPDLITMMSEQLDWTQNLGDAFLAQQADVMSAIQRLRAKAQAEGNLKSSKEQTVTTEAVTAEPAPAAAAEANAAAPPPAASTATATAPTTVIKIEPTDPQVIYVPTYNPTVVYGAWPYPAYPPYYPYPPGYAWGASFFSFTVGVAIGSAFWGNCNWGGGDVDINVNNYNNFNRVNSNREVNNNRINTNQAGQGKWQHDPSHRKGVEYGNSATQQKFGESRSQAAVQSREAFRGHAEQGRQELAGGAATDLAGNRGGQTPGGGAGAANRAAPSTGAGNGRRPRPAPLTARRPRPALPTAPRPRRGRRTGRTGRARSAPSSAAPSARRLAGRRLIAA